MKLTSATEYLYTRRPERIQQRIDRSHHRVRGYAHTGVPASYQYGSFPHSIRTDEVVRSARTEFGRPVRLLDIGCGAAGVVIRHLNEGHDAHGLSLHDYRQLSSTQQQVRDLTDDVYVVGNAENPDTYRALSGEYDVIVSQHTFAHFYDPLAALELAVDRVAEGGYFLCDYLRGGHTRLYKGYTGNTIPAAFTAAGFTPLQGSGGLEMCMRRGSTKLPFRLDVDYATN
ncbi:class I SAM-dependent methyltransferase [Candidatus Saccharibacteria bacterium]|nr:class I SAM-dependent methyltransferase [Candidatus Saccharibacteria bacterium]